MAEEKANPKKPVSPGMAKFIFRAIHAEAALCYMSAGFFAARAVTAIKEDNTKTAVKTTIAAVASTVAGTIIIRADNDALDHFIDVGLLKVC